MRGIDYVKKYFGKWDTDCIECTIVNMQLGVLYDSYDSEEEFKHELTKSLKEFGYQFNKRATVKRICEVVMDRELYERMEEDNAKSDGPLSELEEWQLNNNQNNDTDVDISINDMDKYDGFDIGDATEH